MDKKILDMGIINIFSVLFNFFESRKERKLESH